MYISYHTEDIYVVYHALYISPTDIYTHSY